MFAPSLFIGAAVGGGFGLIVNILFPGTAPYPAYALVGMATVFAATSRATLTSVGVRIPLEMEVSKFKAKRVEDVMSQEVEAASKHAVLSEIQDKILETGHQSFPVLDKKGNLVGIITGHDVRGG